MEPMTVEKLDKVLKERFAGAETELDGADPEEKMSGFLIWPGFQGEDQIDRQAQVWKTLREILSDVERRRVSVIFTLTPAELIHIRSDR